MTPDDADDDRTKSFVGLTSGTRVRHYKIISRIGAGGMGEVYLADDTSLHRRVALKFLPAYLSADENSKARFRREAQAAAALDHENIVTIYEVGEYGDRPFFSMQYVEGQSLRDLISSRSLSLEEAVNFADQICQGLSEAHRHEILHRDIKPSNVVVDSHGRPKLVDFGLATIKGTERLTKTGSAVGTMGYLAPEIVRGEPADARSDVFSLGVLFYELITGRQPFLRDSQAATLHAIVYDSPEPAVLLKPDVPDEIQRIIDRSMDKSRKSRYQSVDELLDDLKAVEHAIGTGVRLPVSRSVRLLRSWFHDHRVSSLTAAILVVLLLFVVPDSRRTILNWFGRDRVPDQRHLAVLPFTDFGNPVPGQAFCNGLMEILSSKLTQMEQFHGSLWVVPASEVREREVSSAGQARRRFGVNLAVSGSIQPLGGQLFRVTLNLIDAKSERQLRAAVIDHPLSDLTILQDSAVMAVANMLEVHLRPEEERILRSGGTDMPEAYDLYLRGQGYLKHAERLPCIDTAIDLFQQALDYDPDYTLALAGLGEAYWEKYSVETDPQWEELAVYNSRRALEVDDQVAPVYVTLGKIYHGTGRYDQAVEEFNRALRLDSANRAAYAGLAKALESANMLDSAEVVYRKAIAARPNHQSGYTDLGLFYVHHGRYGDATEQANQAVALEPEGYVAWNNLGALYYYVGETDRALEMWERSVEVEPNYGALSNLGAVYSGRGNFATAAARYGEALSLNAYDYRIWLNRASALNNLPGQDKQAQEAYAEGIERALVQRQINPRDPWLLADLADAYASVGEANKAVALLEEALELDPENVEIMVTAGSVFERIGNRDGALSMIVEALKRGFPQNQIEDSPELNEVLRDPRFDSMMGVGEMPAADSS